MNNKITIIDLLNKIANGKEIPKKFRYKGETYIYRTYTFEDGDIMTGYGFEDGGWLNIWRDNLNDEVEILDNEDEEKIKVPTEEEVEMLGYKVAKIVKAYQKGVNIALEENDNEDEEKKIPEKLEDISEIKCVGCKVEIEIIGNKTLFDTDTPIVAEHCIYKINQLIKNQKKIIDYLKSKGE